MRAPTLRERILAAVSTADGPISPSGLAAALGAVPGSVRRELVGLRRAGLVQGTKAGSYTTTEPGQPVQERPADVPSVGASAEIVELLKYRYEAVISAYSDYAEEKRFIRIPMSAETCLKPSEIATALGMQGSVVRSRLSEMYRVGQVEKVGDCYKAKSILGRRQSRTVHQVDGWRFRLYWDGNQTETAVIAPYGQERRRLKFSKDQEGYALELYMVGKSRLGATLPPGASKAFGNSYGEPLEVVAYPIVRWTVIDVDVKKFPGIAKQEKRDLVIAQARKEGAYGYEVSRGGGLHIFYEMPIRPSDSIAALQDDVYEDISRRRGHYATRPYKVVRFKS